MDNDKELYKSYVEDYVNGELEHYGRLGMKWGQHIFGVEKQYSRDMKQLRKYDNKSAKKRRKYENKTAKAEQVKLNAELSWTKGTRRRRLKKARRLYRRAKRAIRSSNRNSKRAIKFANTMNKFYADTTISSFSPEDIAIGEKYCIDVLQRSRGEKLRSAA